MQWLKAGYHLGVSPYNSRECSVFNFCFTKFVSGSSRGLKFVILVEDFDNFQFYFGSLAWEISKGGGRKHYYFLFGSALIVVE